MPSAFFSLQFFCLQFRWRPGVGRLIVVLRERRRVCSWQPVPGTAWRTACTFALAPLLTRRACLAPRPASPPLRRPTCPPDPRALALLPCPPAPAAGATAREPRRPHQLGRMNAHILVEAQRHVLRAAHTPQQRVADPPGYPTPPQSGRVGDGARCRHPGDGAERGDVVAGEPDGADLREQRGGAREPAAVVQHALGHGCSAQTHGPQLGY
eukprot:COSAG04_NODE_10904_length_745_cov_0.603715_1_plen_211_part_00